MFFQRRLQVVTNHTYQWLNCFEIFDFIVTEVKVGQKWTVFEGTKAIVESVITEFELLEFWQLREPLESGQAHVD